MPKYDPLRRYLLNASDDDLRLSFSDIEMILGASLPPSASKHQSWWANNAGHGHEHAKVWLDAGWRTRHLDLSTGTVEFMRIGPPTRRSRRFITPVHTPG